MSDPKFDPLKEISNLRDNLSQSLSNLTASKGKFPLVDIYEDDDNVYVVTEPMLGLDMSELTVSMEDDTLILQGITKPEDEILEASYIQREIFYGEFKRTVRIARKVELGKIAATYKAGILKITMPKSTQTDTGQIISVTPVE